MKYIYTWLSFAAKTLGLGISPAAYLSLPVPISMVDFTGVNYASEGARIWDNFYAVCEKDACTFTEPSSMYVHSHMVLFRMTAHR